MFLKMFLFEWRYIIRQPSFYICSGLFFMLAFLSNAVDRVQIAGPNILQNSPFALTQQLMTLSIFFLFPVVNFMAGAAVRDHTSRMAELLYCKPTPPAIYQFGRFLGAFSVVILVFFFVPMGLAAGNLMPWVDQARLGPENLLAYLAPTLLIILPGLFSFSCLFYVLGVRLKSMMPVYLAVIAIFIGNETSELFLFNPDLRDYVALFDPFAMHTFDAISRYWTVAEKNTLMIGPEALLLQNRAIWLGLGLTLIWYFGRHPLTLAPSKSKSEKIAQPTSTTWRINHKPEPKGSVKQFIHHATFEMKQVLLTPAFGLLVIGILMLLVLLLTHHPGLYGTPHRPVTFHMVETIQRALKIFVPIIAMYYSAEVIWREQGAGMQEIIGSLPTSNLTTWCAKVFGVQLVLVVLTLGSMIITICFQLAQGVTQIEIGQYLVRLTYFNLLPHFMLVGLAFFLQVISPNKYAGMLLFVIFIVVDSSLNALGFNHHMLHFRSSPELVYSDMNGYGPYMTGHHWYMLYWGGLTLMLTIVGYGLWNRGSQQPLGARLKQLGYQIGGGGKAGLVMAMSIFLFSGVVIYYNTTILNDYRPESMEIARSAAYEKTFSAFANDPVPTITAVNATVDIFPDKRRIEASASIRVENKSSQPISRFMVSFSDNNMENAVILEGGQLEEQEGPKRTHWFNFDKPLLPGEQRSGNFKVVRQQIGFRDNNHDVSLVENGSFIDNSELFPIFGYVSFFDLVDQRQRRSHDLQENRPFNKLEDDRFYNQSFLGNGFDFIDFEATVSTTPDQIAIAPGYLQKEWTENGRRFFHYKMDQPMLNFYAFTSAKLEVIKEQYRGVSVEIYHHPTHGEAAPSMISAARDSLDYFGQNFSPYQHRQFRIIEFPRYRNFAQSFANTVPFTERGFLYHPRNKTHIDAAYKITAHEAAHQWWGHQVAPANVQGSQVITEALSNYSALMVLEKRQGKEKLRRFLKYELDEYLTGRTEERGIERPLLWSENQDYIHYKKGSVVMMALRDLLGEQRLNQSLRHFLTEFQYKKPYPTTLDLKDYIQNGASETEQAFINDAFERITLYDLKTVSATSKALPDGSYEVTLTFSAQSFSADGKGMETPRDLEALIDIGLFAKHPDDPEGEDSVVYLQKHWVTSGEQTITLVVNDLPKFAGIDPFIKLIDRDSEDNIIGL